jgi:hypothetical protein
VAQYDLRNTGFYLGGDVLGEWGWIMAGGEEGRWPRQRAGVPGEGPANMGNKGAHKHREEVRGRFSYSNWPRKWWKRVVDGEAVLRHLQRGAARGRGNSG